MLYDYIIAGGGLAGLSLACHMVRTSLRDRSILIVDRDPKKQNDRTWGFWTHKPTGFDEIVHRSWSQMLVVDEGDVPRRIALGDLLTRRIGQLHSCRVIARQRRVDLPMQTHQKIAAVHILIIPYKRDRAQGRSNRCFGRRRLDHAVYADQGRRQGRQGIFRLKPRHLLD